MEDGDQKSRILQNYDKWRKSKKKKTANYWTRREQKRQEDDQNNLSSLVLTNNPLPQPLAKRINRFYQLRRNQRPHIA